jgi:hypothetical protein
MTNSFSAFCCFGCGLALATIALLAMSIGRRAAKGTAYWWLVGFAATQALVEWLGVVALKTNGAAALTFPQLALHTVSLAALVEFGRSSLSENNILRSRWLYLLLLIPAQLASLKGHTAWFEIVYCVLLGGQGGMLIGQFVLRQLRAQQLATLDVAFYTAIAFYLLTTIFPMPAPRLVALLFITVAVWLRFRAQQKPEQRGSRLRESCRPVIFCLLLFAGWLFLRGDEAQRNLNDAVAEDAMVAVEAAAPAYNNDLLKAVKLACLAAAPIVALLALATLASKLQQRNQTIGRGLKAKG